MTKQMAAEKDARREELLAITDDKPLREMPDVGSEMVAPRPELAAAMEELNIALHGEDDEATQALAQWKKELTATTH